MMMAVRAGSDGGSARRRRDRQLQASHRHVKTTVAMELATALHHNAHRPRLVSEQQEGEVNETHEAPR